MDPERKRQSAYAALRAFFEQECKLIDRNLEGLLDLLKKNPDQKFRSCTFRAEASYIDDFYNSAENLFLVVARSSFMKCWMPAFDFVTCFAIVMGCFWTRLKTRQTAKVVLQSGKVVETGNKIALWNRWFKGAFSLCS